MALMKLAGTFGLAAVVLSTSCANGPHDRSGAASTPAPAARSAPPPAPAVSPPTDEQAKTVNPIGAATVAFQNRIKEYLAFHNRVEDTVPKLTETGDPNKIAAREKALGEALIKARPDAKEGDFFIKEYQPYLIKTIQDDFKKRPLLDRKALIVELPKGVKVGANLQYPTTIPLATFPPNLLKVLPELPPELEYRIVYRHLILRDVKGNVVVDILRDVFPIPV
jgi:hypothetical protein